MSRQGERTSKRVGSAQIECAQTHNRQVVRAGNRGGPNDGAIGIAGVDPGIGLNQHIPTDTHDFRDHTGVSINQARGVVA